MAAWGVELVRGLDADAREQVVRLREACEAADGSDLKLELSTAHPDAGESDTVLIRTDAGVLGYAGIGDEPEPEACGMVHPSVRRQGAGTELLGAVLAMARQRRRQDVLVICEDAFPAAIEWMRRRGAVLSHSEQRMSVRMEDVTVTAGGMRVRLATDDEAPDIARILASGFAESAEDIEARVRATDPAVEETLVGCIGDDIVATARVFRSPRRPMIYGFVVNARLRGRGHGREMLGGIMDRLRAEGTSQVGLEVDPDNTPAVRLYRGAGFRPVTTYRYMRLNA